MIRVIEHKLSTMKKIVYALFAAIVMVFVLGSCGSSRQVAYFQNADSVNLAASRVLYDARIMPKDQLTITVVTTDPKASAPFNLSVSNTIGVGGQMNNSTSSLQGYLVDNQGDIDFPVVGKLHVAGLTKGECEELVKGKIKQYLASGENPIVTVRMSSFRVAVTGEVASPGVVSVTYEKMSIIESLAQCGDLTIYGKRKNVMLIRQDENGQKHIHYLDLTDANIFNSPYYYLQQNDIIYVEPNNAKKGGAGLSSSTSFWISLTSSLISLTSLIVNLVRN